MKLFQLFIILTSIIFLDSCKKKEINIPTNNIIGIQEVSNFSEIWIFLNSNEKDPIIKDNNLIGSTNWIFNIDKHLKLEKVMTRIQYFQDKRLKKSMHKIDGFNNYLSYSDTISKVLSFVDISNIRYHFDTIQSKKTILKNLDYYKNYNNIHLYFGLNTYYINENKIEKIVFFETLSEFINFTKNRQKTLLHLNFNQEITYQEYLNIKTHLLSLQKNLFLIDKDEYIFDADKISECGCD